MPRAARKRTAAFLFFALVAVSFVVVTRALAERGFSPTLTGEPAWGDGTRCLQVPPAERPLSIRFDNPKSLDLERVFLRLAFRGRRPGARVRLELRADAGGVPDAAVLATADVAPPDENRRWPSVDLAYPLLNGHTYHLVVYALDRTRARLCHLWHADGEPAASQPWAALQQMNGAWAPVALDAGWVEPVFVLDYAGDVSWGQPYWATRTDKTVFAHHVHETRVVPAGAVRLTSINVRFQKNGEGGAPLQYRFIGPNGEILSEGALLPEGPEGPSPWPNGYGLPLAPPLELAGGLPHFFIVEAPFAPGRKQGYRHESPLTDFRTADGLPAPRTSAARRGGGRRSRKASPQAIGSLFFTLDPACGNGVVDQELERCDGPDDGTCPSRCREDCSCGLAEDEDNLAPRAAVTASSEREDVGSVSTSAVDGVIGGLPGDPTHEWVANGEGAGAWLRLEWPQPIRIDRVILHDRPSRFDNVQAASLQLDGETVPVDALAPDGSPTQIVFGPRTILTLTLLLTAVEGTAGLSEIEVLAARPEPPGPPGGPPNPPGPPDPPGPPGPPGPPTPPGTFFLSPDGRDSNSGQTRDKPWRTFQRAFNAGRPLRPGDVLVLLDGTYTPTTTGLPRIDCSSGGTARNGTESSPIVMRADNERRAHLKGDGSGEALRMNNCRYWNVTGIYGTNADNSAGSESAGNVMLFRRSENVVVSRVLAAHPNRTCPNKTLAYCNAHAIGLDEVRNFRLEDSEAYDFHRHGISVYRSRNVDVRRCYVNSRGNVGNISNATGLTLYGSSDSIIENSIAEDAGGINVNGGGEFEGTAGGYRNLFVGNVTLRNRYGSTMRARNFGGPTLPLGDNTVRHSVFASSIDVGLYARGASKTLLENVTLFGTRNESGLIADEDLAEGAPCSANPDGCSITIRNTLAFGNGGDGFRIRPDIVDPWRIEWSNSARNGGANYAPSESVDDDSGNIRRSRSVDPTQMGLAPGQCLLWVPDGSNMKGAGESGADIGARILHRYEGGKLTNIPLWDPASGAFPCGAVVAGMNDVSGASCRDVHRRLNVNTNGCAFPAGYQ